MEYVKIKSPISLADSEIRGYCMTRDCLDIELQAWNGSIVHLKFSGVIGLRDLGGRNIGAVVQINESNELLEAALRKMFERIPEVHDYHVFQAWDNDNCVTMDVIAKYITVET